MGIRLLGQMKIFRKTTVEHEVERQSKQQYEQQQYEQQIDESYGESESIPVFKGQGKRKANLSNKSKSRNTLKHG